MPRYSLRTALIVIAVIASAIGLFLYLSQRGWTVGKVERLIAAEFDSKWGRHQFEVWANSYDFRVASVDPNDPTYYNGSQIPNVAAILELYISDANLGIGKHGLIVVYFYYDREGRLLSRWVKPVELLHAPTRVRAKQT